MSIVSEGKFKLESCCLILRGRLEGLTICSEGVFRLAFPAVGAGFFPVPVWLGGLCTSASLLGTMLGSASPE